MEPPSVQHMKPSKKKHTKGEEAEQILQAAQDPAQTRRDRQINFSAQVMTRCSFSLALAADGDGGGDDELDDGGVEVNFFRCGRKCILC